MVKFSVRKPLTVFVAVLAILILGVVAYFRMTPDLFPNMDFPYVIVMTAYPGASPESVEAEITRPLEQSMATLEHIKTVTSRSSENYSIVMLEFESSVNMDTIGVDIQQNISALSDSWEDSVGTPYVLKINPSVLPVAVDAVAMEGMDNTELTDFVENTLMQKLEGVTGVARVSLQGAITRQVHVVISEEKIDAVNERLKASVDQQLNDAAAELEETKAELEDARRQLDSAEAQLSGGQSALASETAAAEATIRQQEVAALEGRIEIQQQLVALNETRAQLEATLASALPLQERLADADARQAEYGGRYAELDAASYRLAQADAALAVYTDRIAAVEADDSLTDEEKAAAISDITQSADYIAAADAVSAEEAGLDALGTNRYELQLAILSAQTELAAAQAEIAALEAAIGSLGLDRAELPQAIAEMEAGLAQTNEAISLLTETLAQLDEGSLQLSEAMSTLSQTKSESILQLADAAAQLTQNAAAVDQALAQVDSGLESIEDSREDALAAADISQTISLSTVTSILSAQNFSMPAGYVRQDGVDYMVSVGDEMTDEKELSSLLIFDSGEDAIGPVYLSDVAEIFITDNADDTYARLNGEDGLILSFEKQSNAATADVTDNLAARFEELKAEYPGLSFVSLMDQGHYIYVIVETILDSLFTGAIFAIIVLFLFLRDIRPTVITLVSIPVSVVFAVVLMYFSGVTINMISLSGLAVAVGMLVDNSIVVIENIYRLRAKGATAVQAAVAGTKQVAGAITASTLTTVCVFLPIVFVEGITRQLFTDLALTMAYSLMASLVIALTLVPAMARGMLKNLKQRGSEDGEGRSYRTYRRFAAWSLDHKWIVLPLAILLLIGSAWGALSRGFSYMPDVDLSSVNLTITMPDDITREEAVALADEVIARAETIENIESIGAMMGGTGFLSAGDSYDVTVYIDVHDGDSGANAGKRIVELCEDLDCEISYDSTIVSTSYLTGSGVSIYVYGTDMEAMQSAARSIADKLSEVAGLTPADDGLENAAPAIHIAVDRNAAMEKGYTVAQLYMEIASALTESATALEIDMGDVTADVLVEAGGAMTRDQLAELEFDYTDSDGKTAAFRLGDVAELEDTISMSTIRREDQRRYVNVTAQVEEGYNVTLLTSAAQRAVAELTLPDGVSYAFSGENEEIMQAVSDLGLMLLLGIALVYFVMVAQFQSLKGPFIVMFTIPLAFTGGFLALIVCGMDVSIVALIGFIMLTGIIVNNGIVLIDCVNQLRAEGLSRREALIEAGVTRMRPILMTSLTTVLGLIIMALGRSSGTMLMQPIAVVCIGGLLYATVMTLIVVPCIYDIMSKKEITVVTDEDMEFNEA